MGLWSFLWLQSLGSMYIYAFTKEFLYCSCRILLEPLTIVYPLDIELDSLLAVGSLEPFHEPPLLGRLANLIKSFLGPQNTFGSFHESLLAPIRARGILLWCIVTAI